MLLVIVKKGTYNFDYEILKIAYQGVRNVRFSENLACFVFLKHPFWDLPFCLITDENYFNILCSKFNTPNTLNIYHTLN